MSQDEDRILEQVLGRLEGEVSDSPKLTGDELEVQRQYEELSGLLPFALDPVEPGAEVKRALMQRLGAAGASASPEPLAFPAPPPAAPAPPRVYPLRRHPLRRQRLRSELQQSSEVQLAHASLP